MRIVDIRETAIPLNSQLANSSFDSPDDHRSSQDHRRRARRVPVVGLPSIPPAAMPVGRRCGRGSFRAFSRPSPKRARRHRRKSRPGKTRAAMLQREKLAAGERSIAIGTIEVAVWDAVAKIAGEAALAAGRAPQQRASPHGYSATSGVAGICRARPPGPAGRDAPPSRRRLHHGQDEGRRVAARRRRAPGRGGEVDPCPRTQSSPSTPTRNSRVRTRSPLRRRWRRSGCAGSRSRAIRSTSPRCRRSPRPMSRRFPPARTCSRPRTWKISCASGA